MLTFLAIIQGTELLYNVSHVNSVTLPTGRQGPLVKAPGALNLGRTKGVDPSVSPDGGLLRRAAVLKLEVPQMFLGQNAQKPSPLTVL